MTEQFTNLLAAEDEKEFLAFLRSINADQRKNLVVPIKKFTKEYHQYGQTKNNNWGYLNGTEKQRNLLLFASFVCFNHTDFEKSDRSLWMLEKEKASKIIDWYVPDWFSDFLNKQSSSDFLPNFLGYDWVMQLAEKGAIHPVKELIARTLTQIIFEQDKDRNSIYVPENLWKRAITLDEHIWYLFEVETNIHYSDRFLYFGKEISKEKIGWKSAFAQLIREGKLDRRRLLKESLLASNKNFNKVSSGWFAQLFADLQPTKDELLHLQKEMFTVLGASNSKPANVALQSIKKIVSEEDFLTVEFLESIPVLLASDTKAVVISTLQLLEKIGRADDNRRETTAFLACQAFIHTDEEIQSRAAKLIIDQNQQDNAKIREALLPYSNNILVSAKKMLGDLVSADLQPEQRASAEMSLPEIIEAVELPQISGKDDFIFLASQVFDNNNSWHLEHFAAACIQFISFLRADELHVLEPAFQRALNLTKTGVQFNMGYLEHLNAMFCIDFGNYLMRRFPKESESIRTLYKKYDTQKEEKKESWTVSPKDSSYTERWEIHSRLRIYRPYKKLLIVALQKIQQGDNIPLLSTPTHAPCWLHPKTLIDRLSMYIENATVPDDMDFQIAISRCMLKNDPEIIEYVSQKLTGEFRNLFIFLLDKEEQPKGPFTFRTAWMAASLAKRQINVCPPFDSFSKYTKPFANYTGQLKWESVDEEYTRKEYDGQLREYVPVKDRHKIFRVLEEPSEKKPGGIKSLFSGLLKQQKEDLPLLYDFMSIKTDWLSVEDRDIKRVLFLIPNNPEPLLASILHQCMQYPTFSSETDKKLVTAAIHGLHEIWTDFGEMAHVFIGACMISSDKTVANIAGEIWIKAVTNGKINNESIGGVIGKHESIEFAPLKRFTDLTSNSLMRISAQHNKALQIVIEYVLIQLPNEPIKNLKKLLEIYSELLANTGSVVQHTVIIGKLKEWEKSASLQKSAGSLLK